MTAYHFRRSRNVSSLVGRRVSASITVSAQPVHAEANHPPAATPSHLWITQGEPATSTGGGGTGVLSSPEGHLCPTSPTRSAATRSRFRFHQRFDSPRPPFSTSTDVLIRSLLTHECPESMGDDLPTGCRHPRAWRSAPGSAFADNDPIAGKQVLHRRSHKTEESAHCVTVERRGGYDLAVRMAACNVIMITLGCRMCW
jgi:hypothetical protein